MPPVVPTPAEAEVLSGRAPLVPKEVEKQWRMGQWKPRPRGDWEVKANWDVLRALFLELELPLHVCDRDSIQKGVFKACYSILAMLFFLQTLALNHDCTIDFAHPLDTRLASE